MARPLGGIPSPKVEPPSSLFGAINASRSPVRPVAIECQLPPPTFCRSLAAFAEHPRALFLKVGSLSDVEPHSADVRIRSAMVVAPRSIFRAGFSKAAWLQ